MMGVPYLGEVADVMLNPPIFTSTQFKDGGHDAWGVRYIAAEGTNRATMRLPVSGLPARPGASFPRRCG